MSAIAKFALMNHASLIGKSEALHETGDFPKIMITMIISILITINQIKNKNTTLKSNRKLICIYYSMNSYNTFNMPIILKPKPYQLCLRPTYIKILLYNFLFCLIPDNIIIESKVF